MYSRDITTRHRTLIVILVDRSRSMCEEVEAPDGKPRSKADVVASVVSRLLSELVARARREDEVHDYYDIALLGYSGDSAYHMLDPSRDFVPVAELAQMNPETVVENFEAEMPDGTTVMRHRCTERWIKPEADGETPMYEALTEVCSLVGRWCSRACNADSFPPMVINITDGEATDGDSEELKILSERIRRIRTSDGNTLLMNIHITSEADAPSLVFPTRGEINRDNRYAALLAECSSDMPAPFEAAIRECRGERGEPPYVAMGYNTSMTELLTMLDIGSRSVTEIR